MVRFKAIPLRRYPPTAACFHPTMVRFKAADLTAQMASRSHVSIPLWCDLKGWDSQAVSGGKACFHPTMVRFKAYVKPWVDITQSSFHPTMVRFKADRVPAGYTAHLGFHPTMVRFKALAVVVVLVATGIGFHPTMVRFKAGPPRSKGGALCAFPSHYGAI